ncbi:MAG: hypothetical protein ACLQKA_20120 [Bryobacteraceae bacterium]
MKDVDEVRGYEREILFNPENLYKTGGGLALTNCVVEAVEDDWQGGAPVLSLRFYHKPYLNPGRIEELAKGGQEIYTDTTPIGIEIALGIEMARSVIEQISEKWPELLRIDRESSSEPTD